MKTMALDKFQCGYKAEAISDCGVWISKHFINTISNSLTVAQGDSMLCRVKETW